MSVLSPSALKIVNEIAYLFPCTESFVKKSATLNNAASKFLRNAGHLHKGLIFLRDTFSCGLAHLKKIGFLPQQTTMRTQTCI